MIHYLYYLYKVDSVKATVLKNSNIKSLLDFAKANNVTTYKIEDNDIICINSLVDLGEEVFRFYELDASIHNKICDVSVPLFNDEQREIISSKSTPYIITKESLTTIINAYEDKIRDVYNNILNSQDLAKDAIKYIKDRFNSLTNIPFANVDIKYPWVLTNTWSLENTVYTLIHILKSVNWEEDVLLFCGW